MRKQAFAALLFLAANIIQAQNITDVVRWSNIEYVGTARTLGAGSSFGAMGGDFSVININPAGIADYRISEFVLTPSLRNSTSRSWFTGDVLEVSNSKSNKLGLDNIGFVIASNPGTKLTSSNFAIGYSRIADLNRSAFISGKIPGSITTYFADQAQNLTVDELDDFIAYPAYNVGAILKDENNNTYYTDFTDPKQMVSRTQDIYQRGGIDELAIGWAGEIDHKLNLGLSMNLPFARFEELKTYNEVDSENDEVEYFDRLSFTERLNTSGIGFNFKAGFVYKINQVIRIGGSFHSPTWYSLNDDYSNTIEYVFTDARGSFVNKYNTPDGTFGYNITTPWRAIGSLGTILRFGEIKGFLNGDIEYVDYTNASYKGKVYNGNAAELAHEREVNRDILDKLGTAVNVRLGGEFAYNNLRLRVGYGIERTPYIADDFYNNKVSFGLGFRDDNFFIDLGVRISQFSEGYNPYIVRDASLNPLANIDTNKTRANFTIGFKF